MAANSEESSTVQPARVILWSLPRSCSTVFTRCIEALGECEIFWEPFLSCHFYGPERRNFFADDSPDLLNSKYTYGYVRDLMEGDFPGASFVFAKDVTKGIVGKYEYIPRNFRHSFLIRDPQKVFPAIQRLSDKLPLARRFSVKEEYGDGYRELDELVRHIDSQFGQDVVLIDADDVLSEPERILPKYCRAVGLEYDPKMLRWDEADVRTLKWHCAETMAGYEDSMGLFTNALKSSEFIPTLTEKSNYDESNWSPEIRECIEEAMPVYERLHKMRLIP